MEIVKTYDLKNIKDALQKQIDATMKTNSSIVKIDLLTAVYITDILETVISMEEEKTIHLNKILKDLGCEEVEEVKETNPIPECFGEYLNNAMTCCEFSCPHVWECIDKTKKKPIVDDNNNE